MEIMTEPQSWVLIGLFTTIMLGGMTLMTTFITRTIDGLRGEMNARFAAVDARFEAVDARFDAMSATVDARFDAISTKIEHLDRDVTAITRRMWGEPTGE
ncbi:MAG: hypothetical protein QM677_08260 [Microbacterium sp.]